MDDDDSPFKAYVALKAAERNEKFDQEGFPNGVGRALRGATSGISETIDWHVEMPLVEKTSHVFSTVKYPY